MRSPRVAVSSLFLVLLVLCASSFASSDTSFSNNGGTLSGSNAGLSLSGSTLVAVSGYNGNSAIGDLGTLSFTTGALTSGSLQQGGTFAAGGTFNIQGNGTDGLNGTLFAGSFTSPVTWTLVTLANGTHNYTLSGVVTGTMNGMTVSGVTVQLTVNSGKGYFDGAIAVASGETNVTSTVPEPSTLALFGSGLVGMISLARRKLALR